MTNHLAAQQSLTNFYVSVQFKNPAMALLMSDHIRTVALYGLSGDRRPAYQSVIRLRELAQGLPMVYARILDLALEDLGYAIDYIQTQVERQL